MRPDCVQHQFGCSCTQTQCKSHAVHLGRFTKPRPAPYDTTTPQYALIGLFVLLAACFVWVFVAAPAFERVKLKTQEDVYVVSK